MPNIASVLRDEITRLARKEIRVQTAVLQRSSAQHRRDIADLKREVASLKKKVALLEKQAPKKVAATVSRQDAGKLRFVASGFKSHRERVGLSAKDYGRLIGVSEMSIYNWESGQTKPRREHLPVIAAVRKMGKREAKARLEQLG